MSYHSLIDKVSTSIGSLFVAKYFRNGLETVSLKEHLKSCEIKNISEIQGAGDYEIKALTLAGELTGLFRVANWKGNKYPTIVYHHGASEIPFDYGFKKIFSFKKQDFDVNLILIQAPFHASRKDFKNGMTTLNNFIAMIAVSIRVIEELFNQLNKKSDQPIIVSGTSLGGYITNFHHIYFNKKEIIYVPLLAGVNIFDTLFNSIYSKGVNMPDSKTKKELSKLLNFTEEFASVNNSNVYPLLGIYDQLVRYKVQKESYGSCPVSNIQKGHFTGSLAAKKLREHILSCTNLDF